MSSVGSDQRWLPPDLSGFVACVAGASYGVGRGVAQVLGECGATVYVTGRSTRAEPTKSPSWTVEDTAALVTASGGRGVPVQVDHTDEHAVDALFSMIGQEHGRLDLLVTTVWQWGPVDDYIVPSSQQPVARWDAMIGVGAKAQFLTASRAVPLMTDRGGLIVAVQERPGAADRFGQNIVVDTAAVAMQRMVEFLANELSETTVASVLLYPGWTRTVNMGMGFDPTEFDMTEDDLEAVTQSPQLLGRAVAALAADRPGAKRRSGATLYVGEVAEAYGFTDIDGRIPAVDESFG